jgi:hypothetical protein
MSSHGNGEQIRYQVHASKLTRDGLRRQRAELAKAGKSTEFVSALRRAYERLQTAPLEFGEPLYRLPAMKLLVRQAMIGKLVIDYGIHEELPLVFIRSFRYLD